MITEKDIAKRHQRSLAAPIRIGTVTDFGIPMTDFIAFFAPFFEHLSDDYYAVHHKQLTYLKATFPEDKIALDRCYRSADSSAINAAYQPWIDRLSKKQREEFKHQSRVTRQRAIATFEVILQEGQYHIQRIQENGFAQEVADLRSKQRLFTEASLAATANPMFETLLRSAVKMVHSIHASITQLKITSHWMRTLAHDTQPGENAPEGIHEDGADYIMSALVVNRTNIQGGATQIFEKSTDGETTLLFEQELSPGHFAFQADTGEEKTFGNDLWHYVTPIQPIDPTQLGIRDIIGFDIHIVL